MVRMRFHMRRPSYAVVASVLAVVSTTAGTAVAAKLQTKARPATTLRSGADVSDSTITGADVKNKALASTDFQAKRVGAAGTAGTRGAAGPVGPVGEPGATGADGPKGSQGPVGPVGVDAVRQFSYSYREAGGRFRFTINPNSVSNPWYLRNAISPTLSPVFITGAGTIMTDLAQADGSGGVLNLTRANTVTVAATISLVHRGDINCTESRAINMDAPTTPLQTCGVGDGVSPANTPTAVESDDVAIHTRAECWVMYANADGTAPARIGESVYVSDGVAERIVDVPVTAGTTLQPGSYTFRTMCRIPDRASQATLNDWEFVQANMSVLAAAVPEA